ncbi:MAG: metallophosphoesterase [Alphaproteobacteria bacterium]|nr:metallophosphoesterase [Alphaproteobacteria bacterium]
MRIAPALRGLCMLATVLTLLMLWSQSAGAQSAAKVIFIADNQHVEDHGFSVGEQSYFADQLIPVARRPSLTNVFSLRILQYVLQHELANKKKPTGDVVIHLGDAINNGCVSEFQEFTAAMTQHSQRADGSTVPWYMAPGNHDSYFLGISHPTKEKSSRFLPSNLENKRYWFALCRNMRGFDRIVSPGSIDAPLMTKQKFIKSYLGKVVERFNTEQNFGLLESGSELAKLATRHRADLRCSDNTGAKNLNRVCWYVNKDKPWQGFVIQEVRVRVGTGGKLASFLLIDTCDFERPPQLLSVSMYQGAGANGAMSDLQLAIVARWLEDNKKEGILTTLVGHHPFEMLKSSSLFGVRFGTSTVGGHFRKWSSKGLFDRYYSAHTHKGFSTTHQTNEDASGSFIEVNVGSLVDKPSEYVVLNVAPNGSQDVELSCTRTPITRRIKYNKEDVGAKEDPQCPTIRRAPLYDECYKYFDLYEKRDADIPSRYANFPQRIFNTVQKVIYSRIQLRKDFASDKRGQRTHLRALAQELFGYSSIFSSLDIEADLASEGRSITPVCYRAYNDTCDASCEDRKHSACDEADKKKWRADRARLCRKASTLDSECNKNFDVRSVKGGDWVRTNGRVLDSSRAVRHYLHYYLSTVLSASRAGPVCSGERWDLSGICRGPDTLEIELARFNEAVKLFLKRNSGPVTARRNLCFALLSSNFDIVNRGDFNPLHD